MTRLWESTCRTRLLRSRLMSVDFSHASVFWSYGTHADFCCRLSDSAPTQPVPSPDPIDGFVSARPTGAVISSERCRDIAPRMRELLATWPDVDSLTWRGRLVADGIALAGRRGESFTIN